MRRPVKFLAGLLLATGATLAFSAPAVAAPSLGGDFDYEEFEFDYEQNLDYDLRYDNDVRTYEDSLNTNGNQINGIALLSGITGGA